MRVLVVVDMQNDFIDGALGTKEAVAIIENVKNKIVQYREENQSVIFTRDTHNENYLKTREGKYLPVEHCIKETFGWKITDRLPVGDGIVIDKPTFGSIELVEHIKNLSGNSPLEGIEFIGLCTDICVISNAMICKAAFPETDIIVDSSCCAGVTPQSHQTALDAMKMCQIVIL